MLDTYSHSDRGAGHKNHNPLTNNYGISPLEGDTFKCMGPHLCFSSSKGDKFSNFLFASQIIETPPKKRSTLEQMLFFNPLLVGLIWVCTVCLRPFYWFPRKNGLRVCHHEEEGKNECGRVIVSMTDKEISGSFSEYLSLMLSNK